MGSRSGAGDGERLLSGHEVAKFAAGDVVLALLLVLFLVATRATATLRS